MSDTKAWGDCPKCYGSPDGWNDIGVEGKKIIVPKSVISCPTCHAHFKAVDEAVEQTATAILGAYGIDGHVFGSRPCPTCRKMTEILGAPFGCVAATIRAHPQCQPPTKEGGKE